MSITVVIADDEPLAQRLMAAALEDMGCTVVAVSDAEGARAAVDRIHPDLVFLDLMLGDANGLDLLRELLAERPSLWVVLVTAHAGIDTAVEAMRRGARDYLTKPFTSDQIRLLVEQAMERRDLQVRLEDLELRLRSEVPGTDLSTSSPAMRQALSVVGKAATADTTVLLRGESGTGKGVLARAIHDNSPRAGRGFVVVNCPTLSEELLASELFGHARGSFTGAMRDQPGRVEAAEGGTLFLDEISEIRPALQAKLLRFLQDKEFERVGESRLRRANVRIVAATNRDLDAAVAAGEFREDLYYRLSVVEVKVPPLRERPGDVLALAQGFVDFFAAQAGRKAMRIDERAARVCERYEWPGNVRELRNAIERAVVFASGGIITVNDLPERMHQTQSTHGPQLGGNHSLDEIELAHMTRILERTPSLDEAARIMGIDPSTLYRKRKRLGI
jgi:two-component system, NtrC family, response regulator AlgB